MDTQIEDMTCSRQHRVFTTELGLSSCLTAPYSFCDNSLSQTLSLLLITLGPSVFNLEMEGLEREDTLLERGKDLGLRGL